MNSPSRIIAIEEAFWLPETKSMYPAGERQRMDEVSHGQLEDVGEARIRRMDEAGIDLQVLSHASPGPQGFSREQGRSLAEMSNTFLARMIKQYPKRFAAFAALPTHDPQEAVATLERTVTKEGFCGALINNATEGHYLDEKEYWPIFERAQALNVPIYLHPAKLPAPIMDFYFKNYPELSGAAWGWALDTGTHLLRIICAGVFDAYPRLQIVVGHMGELIPFHLNRIQRGIGPAQGKKFKRSLPEYMRDNVYITTSGVFEHSALVCAMSTVGIDRIIFSVDDPFADNKEGVEFLKTAPVSIDDREKLAYRNAEKILRF